MTTRSARRRASFRSCFISTMGMATLWRNSASSRYSVWRTSARASAISADGKHYVFNSSQVRKQGVMLKHQASAALLRRFPRERALSNQQPCGSVLTRTLPYQVRGFQQASDDAQHTGFAAAQRTAAPRPAATARLPCRQQKSGNFVQFTNPCGGLCPARLWARRLGAAAAGLPSSGLGRFIEALRGAFWSLL